MRTLLVGYDLNHPGQNYIALIQELESCGAWWHHLDSTWLVRTELAPVELRDKLKALIDHNDELLVIDVTGRGAAWTGFSERGGNWIRDHL